MTLPYQEPLPEPLRPGDPAVADAKSRLAKAPAA
jgi:hypothetical protein